MPVKLKQWHFAQAPQTFYDALVTVRLQHMHLKAISAYYDNIISDAFPSRSLVYDLYDQIVESQREWLAAKDHLAAISDDIGYFEDLDRMAWITRPDRRRYQYEGAAEEEAKHDAVQRSVMELSEMTSDISIDYSSSDSNFESDSDMSSRGSSSSQETTPPSSPPPMPDQAPKRMCKKVRFAPLRTETTRKRGLSRIRTKEEAEEEFQAVNAIATKALNGSYNARKRRRPDGHLDGSGPPMKRLKRSHASVWPVAYFETV